MIYEQPTPNEPLSQGDIIDDCRLVFWKPPDSEADPISGTVVTRVAILTQACDLAQSKSTRVQVAVVHTGKLLVDRGVLKAKTIRDQIRRHRVYGWYFLPSGTEIEESIVDLRDIHTLPRAMLERLINDGKRVCRIRTPYREHLAQHFSTTYARIALPDPYETEPDD